MASRVRNLANLREYFSLSRLRANFRNRSWISSRGGNTLNIARRIMEPLRPHFDTLYNQQRNNIIRNATGAGATTATANNSNSTTASATAASNNINNINDNNSDTAATAPFSKLNPYFVGWVYELSVLLKFGGCSEHNSVEVYNNGPTYFEALWSAIDNAKHKVYMETYTLEADETGIKTLEKLEAAVRRGYEVRLIVDGFGSSNLKPSAYQSLIDAGATVHVYNPPHLITLLSNYWQPWTRNHRKLSVIDDTIGFTGGTQSSSLIADQRSFTKQLNLFYICLF